MELLASLYGGKYEGAGTITTMNVNYFELPPNMDRVCRICLSEGTNLSPIFCTEEDVTDFSGLAQKIQICGAIEMHERDGLPSLICDVCIYKASVAHEFRQQCQNSDARLRLYYDKPAKSSVTNSTTQTDSNARICVAKKIDNSQTNYFIKNEMQGLSQELSNSMEVYTQNENAVVAEANHIETEDKLFLCNIGFDGAKEIEKNAVIMENHEHPEQNLTTEVSQVTIVATMDTNEPLEHQVISTISEIKTNNSTEEFINAHILTSVVDRDEDDENDIIGNDEAALVNNGDEDDDEEIGTETIEQLETHESEQSESNDKKWIKEVMNENDILPKRLTRNAKSIAGKSSYEIEMDDDSQDGDLELKFKCKICSRRYTTQKGLKNHSQVHDKQHKCPICLKSFYKLENMDKHSKIHESKPHACQICHTSFAKSQSLTRHLKIHTDKLSNDETKSAINDEMINFEIKKDKSEIDNTDDDNDDDEQVCAQTNETDEFDCAPDLYKCDVCNQFCSTLKNLKRHSLMHGDKKYSCTVCKKWFFRPDTLKKHAEKHGHGLLDNLIDENKLYESDDESFNRTSSVSTITSNENIKRDESDEDGASGEYKCQHCDKIMATKKGLRRHVSMHKPKAEPATCEICKKVCASQARLVLHQKTHNKPKEKVPREYLCHICSKVYPSNSSLTYHMRTHTGVKPHVCKTCNSGFTTTTSLANHIRIHTGDKPFVCHVCSAAFAVSSAFRRHLTRHTGEANYLCKTCGKAFKRLSTLKEHTYTHSGEKPYVCKTCGAAYSHSGSLFAHQKRCRAQYGEMVTDEHHNHVAHHIHVNNVQSAVRSLAVIGQIF
ncbi:hypothetical protein PV326_008740 [Microctonus aethiopoides]|nr:hypothetical protein PV326_008740 [Microctonus aethiopoides]